MKYIADPYPKVAPKRNLSFGGSAVLHLLFTKLFLMPTDTSLRITLILGFWQRASFSSASLGWFQTRRVPCPIFTLSVWQHYKDCKKMTWKASLVSTGIFSWWLQFTCQPPPPPPSPLAFYRCSEGKKNQTVSWSLECFPWQLTTEFKSSLWFGLKLRLPLCIFNSLEDELNMI